MTNLTFWVLLLPLIGFIILGLAGRLMSRTAILTVALGACGLAFLCAALGFISMLGTPASARTSDQVIYTWITSGDFQVSFGLLFDSLSAVMLMIVTGVGLLIHTYSPGSLEDYPGFWPSFPLFNFFSFPILLLVTPTPLPSF